MTAQISKSEQDERGLLPYPVIIAATKGDPGSYEHCHYSITKAT